MHVNYVTGTVSPCVCKILIKRVYIIDLKCSCFFPAIVTCVIQVRKGRKLNFISDGVLPSECNGEKAKFVKGI